jgi:hypothetical protein
MSKAEPAVRVVYLDISILCGRQQLAGGRAAVAAVAVISDR